MNREQRRNWWKTNRKDMSLGSWDQFNLSQNVQVPYVNYEKRQLKQSAKRLKHD